MVNREPAKFKKVKDLFKGEYKESTGMDQPHRIETDQDTYSRINTVSTVEDTYKNPEETYGSIQISDSTATIRVKAFEDTIHYLEDIDKGDLVKVIGKIRKDEEGRFINGEIIKKLENPEYAKLRELELKQKTEKQEKNKEQEETEEKEESEETESGLEIQENTVE